MAKYTAQRKLMPWTTLLLLLITQMMGLSYAAAASLVLNDSVSNTTITNTLQGPGLTVSNLSVIAGAATQYGTFSGGASSLTLGSQVDIESGIFMATGHANSVVSTQNAVKGPNGTGGISSAVGKTYTDTQLTSIDANAKYDPVILKMQILPTNNYFKMTFVFASDEYMEYACSSYNDAFGVFIKPSSAADLAANWTNIAKLPNSSTPISINTVNGSTCKGINNSAYYKSNGTGTTPTSNTNLQFDGLTIPLTVNTAVSPGTLYDVKLAIADAGDYSYDSAMFIKWVSSAPYPDDIDLELGLQANKTALNIGDSAQFTLTIKNKGQSAISGAKVAFALPTGFTYVSDTSSGSYDVSTGMWSIPSSLAAVTGTSSIIMTATASTAGVVNGFAQVSVANANDIDSTPGNGTQSPPEDDEATLTLTVTGYDYSDAPATYGTPSHAIASNIQLGVIAPDNESAAQPNSAANLDDTTGVDDEDAITSFPVLTAGATTYTLSNIPLANTTGATATLYGWIDANLDGKFDGNEVATASVSSGTTSATLNWTGLTGIKAGTSYVRLRLTTQALTNTNSGTTTLLDTRSTTATTNGEVEDYAVTVLAKGIISGVVFRDDDQSNTKNGSESGINLITVSVYTDNGTPNTVSDDTLVTTTETAAGGTYTFTNLDPGTYRVVVNLTDPDLPTGALIGTTHPQTGVTVTAGNTTTVNFGFDIFSCVPGGGTADTAISTYISKEVEGGSIAARSVTDSLDDTWRAAAGLPTTGTLVPWLGTTVTSISSDAPALFKTYGVAVDVASVNIQPASPCLGSTSSASAYLSTSDTLQGSAPRPSSLYNTSAQPASWYDAGGDSQSPNAVRFTFATPVKRFGAWFGDLETRTDGNARPAWLRLLDSSGNRIGQDIPITPTDISNGTTNTAVDQNLCGSVAPGTDHACGNQSTRWVGFVDNTTSARIKSVLVIVGDDDFGDDAGLEQINFIGMDIVQEDFGDAPASYGDAIHWLDLTPKLYLGSTAPDKETKTQNSANGGVDGLGDDNNGDDEDGVANFPTLGTSSKGYSLNVTLNNTSGSTARLVGWIDFDGNGTFDTDEATTVNVASGATNKIVALTWKTLPSDIKPGASYVRLRLTTDSNIATGTASTSLPTGSATDGEVEDYPLNINDSGYNVSGRVFNDVNVNAIDNTEKGIKSVTIVLHDQAANTCQSTKTDADGNYLFTGIQPATANNYVLYQAATEKTTQPDKCPPTANAPNGYVFTTPSSLTITVSHAAVTGQNFGDVKKPTLTLDNEKVTLPDTSVFYPHIFRNNAAGSVVFNLMNEVAEPAGSTWGSTLYIDTNCNAKLNSNDTPITTSISLVGGEKICLLVKVLTPANVSAGASHSIQVQSTFTFGNGTVVTDNNVQTRLDLTRVSSGTNTTPVGGEGKLSLEKSVWNTTRNIDGSVALPGETLRYTIRYENIGNGVLNELAVHDSIPAFTSLVEGSIQCVSTPTELSACSPSNNAGSLDWNFTGKLQAGSQGSVAYDVMVE